MDWGRYLQNTPVCKENGAVFDETRLDVVPNDQDEDDEPRTNEDGDVSFGQPDEPHNFVEMSERLGTMQSTLLMEDRATPPTTTPCRANPETDEVDVAPGEGKTPISVVWDRKAEVLAFPGVYLGISRTFSRAVGHSLRYHAMRSEVHRIDRRGAPSQHILYKYNGSTSTSGSRPRSVSATNSSTAQRIFKARTSRGSSSSTGISSPAPRRRASPCRACCTTPRSTGGGAPTTSSPWCGSAPPPLPHAVVGRVPLQKLHRQHGELDRFARDPVVCAMYFREIVMQLKKYLGTKMKRTNGEVPRN